MVFGHKLYYQFVVFVKDFYTFGHLDFHFSAVADTATQIAEFLLGIKALRLSPEVPYTWASGWRSPVYCDNRLTLSYPDIRNAIADAFVAQIKSLPVPPQAIAGVATAGLPHGVLVADRLGLPFLYVRSKPKGHGLGNQIEGRLEAGTRVVVIEDLISTGGSSKQAADALMAAGAEIVGLLAIFTYGFPQAETAFSGQPYPVQTLSNLSALLAAAHRLGYLPEHAMATLHEWRQDPANWHPKV
jgi:orotate phosphoribosyltransferase